MAESAAFLSLAGVWLLAVMTPGPDFLAIVHTSVTRSRSAGLSVVLGVLLGMTCWSFAALSGLSLLFSYLPWLHGAIKVLGAIYLMVLGVQLITGRNTHKPHHPDPLATFGTITSFRQAVRRGLLTNLGNPKALAMFGSMVAVVLPADASLWAQATVLAILLGIPALWYPLVVLAFSHHRVKNVFEKFRMTLDRFTGGVFLYLGIRLAIPND